MQGFLVASLFLLDMFIMEDTKTNWSIAEDKCGTMVDMFGIPYNKLFKKTSIDKFKSIGYA